MSNRRYLTEAVPTIVGVTSSSRRVMTRRMYNLAMGRAIVVLRSACGLTSAELTANSGVAYARLQQIEKGLISASVDELHLLAQFFGTSLSELVAVAEALASLWRM